jgi:hypothetical protein
MVKHVSLDQNSPKLNKDENMLVVVHMTWKLAAQKKNVLLLRGTYSLANSILEICALEAILMIGTFWVISDIQFCFLLIFS